MAGPLQHRAGVLMRLRRVMVRGLVGVVALVVVLLALAAVVSQTATFRDWLRRQVVTRVNAGLNGEVTIGRLEGNLVQGLVVTDVRLRSEGRRVLAVRRVAAGYDLVRLLTGGGLVLRDVELSGLALDLVEDERGWNVARLSPPTPEPQQPSTLEVVLDRARLADASVKVVRRADVWRVRDLRVILHADGLVLQGRTATYHAKQMAQHIAMEASDLPILANEIVVL